MTPEAGLKMISLVLLFLVTIDDVTGHGALVDPPMRSYAWKVDSRIPINYDWNALYCGGFHVFQENGGKCGVCGDPYNGPFENDKGGFYDTGIIVKHYPAGVGEIKVTVTITAHHKGFFQFKICPNNERNVTQACLDRNVLRIREAPMGDDLRFYPQEGNPRNHTMHVILPPDMVCDRCVLQWTYKAGNSVGRSESGESCLGCGMQETFVNCADISIGGNVESVDVVSNRGSGPEVVINELEDVNKMINTFGPEVGEGFVQPDNNNNNNNNNMNRFRGARDPTFEPTFEPTGMRPPSREGMMFDREPVSPLNTIDARIQANVNPSFTQSEMPVFADMNHHQAIDTHRSIFPPMQGPGSTRFQHPGSFINRLPVRLPERMHIPRPSAVTGPEHQFIPNTIHREPHSGMNIPHIPSSRMLPPPSRVTNPLNPQLNNINSVANQIPRDHRAGAQTTLLGSVSNVVNQIHNPNRFASFSNSSPNRHVTTGSRVPSSKPLHVPQTMYHQHSSPHTSNILPSTRQNFHPSVLAAVRHSRENWLSGRQSQLRRHKLRISSQKASSIGRSSRLPRRIVVHSTSIAQHLLNRYPQLKGRVYLSRRAHARSKHSQRQHRFARHSHV